jgi:hypothetical protein
MRSSNGTNWLSSTAAEANRWISVCWSQEAQLFVAVGESGNNRVMISSNGINWSPVSVPLLIWNSVCWSRELGVFLAVAQGGTTNCVMTSPDGTNWTQRTAINARWHNVVWSPELGLFAAVADSGTVAMTLSLTYESAFHFYALTNVLLDKSEETRCTSYARKCLSQYGLDYLGGSAWEALRYLKSRGGKEKYNMFNNLDYSNLENNIKKIGKNYKSICDTCFKPKDGTNINVDNECDSNKLGKTISDFYPSSSSIDLGSLELGDIVGIYWAGSGNKGKAFCQKASIDDKNAITNKNTTINTHLGFVGAIKNGEPIIALT